MGAEIRAFDWSATPLGPTENWPPTLKTAVGLMLGAAQPVYVAYGPELTSLYNDGYLPIVGTKHPAGLGTPFSALWAEIWEDFAPIVDATMAGEAQHFTDLPIALAGRPGLPLGYFTFSYTALRDDNGKAVGFYCAATETTNQVLAHQKLLEDRRANLAQLEQMPGFVAVLTGSSHVFNYVNQAYRAIAGDREFLGRSVRDVFPELAGQGFYELLDQVYASGEPFTARSLPVQFEGEANQRHIDLLYQPLRDDEGAVSGIFVGGYDITDRIEAERALLKFESRSSQALDATSEGFYAVDCTGATTLCNNAFVRMLGFADKAAPIGQALHGVIHHSHPDGSHYDRDDCPIYRAAATGVASFVSEELFFRLDGTSFPVEYRAEPIYIDGELTGAICTFNDISERKASQAALAASEAEFGLLAEAMPNHVWTSPPDGQLNWFNKRVYEYGGAEPGVLDGTGWVDMVHPDDRAAAGERWASALASGDNYEIQFRLRRADGVYRWHLARAIPIRGADGAIRRWIGTNTDIEDQKATAAALAVMNDTLAERVAEESAERDRLWQTSQDLLVVVDEHGIFTAANPAWITVLGWTPAEVIGQNHLSFVHPDHQPDSQSVLEQALTRPIKSFENQCLHKDGSTRWISWIASSDGGTVYATGRNVDAEKKAALELAATQEALRQSQKMEAVGQLTGGIAHDFNNMLAVVIGSLDLLGRRIGTDDARSKRYIDAAMDGGQRAAALTKRLLAFSRQQPLDPEPVDPNKLVAGMSDLLSHSIGAEIRLETVLAGGVWRIHVDRNQLENVILNLAVNARDAMPSGGRLTIETQNAHLDERYAAGHQGVPAGQYVLIAVSDTGEGMPDEVIAKAFDPFFTTKAVGKGTGLGLSQVYGFVKQSGGHVKIYSEPGEGTTVKIYLPRLTGSLANRSEAAIDLSVPQGEAQEVILVVDDENAVRQFSADALTELGYHVLEAESAEVALQLLASHPEIVLVFTDVIMPDMNGRKLADEVRRRHPGLRILFTTGYTRNAVVHNGVLDADVELISKPFTVEELATRVREILDKPTL